MALKINLKTERKQKCKTFNWLIEQKQTSANFHRFSDRRCKQRHLSMELSGMRSAFPSHLTSGFPFSKLIVLFVTVFVMFRNKLLLLLYLSEPQYYS